MRIRKLKDVLVLAGRGDFSARATPGSMQDEIDELADAVNALLDHAQERCSENADLEALRRSEARHRTVGEHANEMIVVLQDGLLKYCNPMATEVSGYTLDELQSRPFTEFVHPDDHRDVIERYALRMSGEQFDDTYSFRLVRKDGEVRWAEVRAVLIDWEGRPAILDLVTDITERKVSEDALRRSEEHYRTIFENTGNASILIGEDTTILLANSNFEKLTGYSKEEMEGRMSWTVFIAPEDLDMMKAYHAQRRNDPDSAPGSYEFRLKNRAGELRDIFLTIAMIPGTKESVASCMDITGRKQAEVGLRLSEEKYRSMLESMEEGYFETDLGGSFTFPTKRAGRISGTARKKCAD